MLYFLIHHWDHHPQSISLSLSWTYDTSVFSRTIVHSYDLVCDRAGLKNVAQSVYFLGLVVGVSASGWLSDQIGRRTVVLPMCVVYSLTGAASAYMPDVYSFMAVRFFQVKYHWVPKFTN